MSRFLKLIAKFFQEELEKNMEIEGPDEIWENLQVFSSILYDSVKKAYENQLILEDLIVQRFQVVYTSLSLRAILAFSTIYESAVFSLRLLLEDYLRAVYLDKMYPNLPPNERLEKIENTKNFIGEGLVKIVQEKYEDADWIKGKADRIKSLFSELHPYVHAGKATVDIDPRLDHTSFFSYNSTKLYEVTNLQCRVYDTIFYITLCLFPEAKDAFFSNKTIRQKLDEEEYPMTREL